VVTADLITKLVAPRSRHASQLYDDPPPVRAEIPVMNLEPQGYSAPARATEHNVFLYGIQGPGRRNLASNSQEDQRPIYD
jgi:hypothetical protein